MAVFRFLAYLFLIIATVALVSDATPTTTVDKSFSATPLAEHWRLIAPSTLAAFNDSVASSRLSFLWNGLIAPILSIPTFVLFSALGVLCGYLGRRRYRVDIFIN